MSRLREDIAGRLNGEGDKQGAFEQVVQDIGLSEQPRGAGGRLSRRGPTPRSVRFPTQKTVVFERFFDESGGMQLVIHSPFGSRINRAWGLALRKRFCTKFNFELQAAATEDSIVLSLSTSHSFPLESVAHYLQRQDRAARSSFRRCSMRRCSARGGAGSPERRWRCRAFKAARRCPRRCSGCARRI